MAKNNVGENAVQRMLRALKGLKQELIRPTSEARIELRLDAAEAGELMYISAEGVALRLYGGPIEDIEAFFAADPLDRMLMARADGERE